MSKDAKKGKGSSKKKGEVNSIKKGIARGVSESLQQPLDLSVADIVTMKDNLSKEGLKDGIHASKTVMKEDVDELKRVTQKVVEKVRTGKVRDDLGDASLSMNAKIRRIHDPIVESVIKKEDGTVDAVATTSALLRRGNKMPWSHCICGGRVGYVRLSPILFLTAQYIFGLIVYTLGALIFPLGDPVLYFTLLFHVLYLASAVILLGLVWVVLFVNNIWAHLIFTIISWIHVSLSILPTFYWCLIAVGSTPVCLVDAMANRLYCAGLFILSYGAIMLLLNYVFAAVLALYWLISSIIQFFEKWDRLKQKQFENELAERSQTHTMVDEEMVEAEDIEAVKEEMAEEDEVPKDSPSLEENAAGSLEKDEGPVEEEKAPKPKKKGRRKKRHFESIALEDHQTEEVV